MHPPRRPTDFPLLLEVFREGLVHGIIPISYIIHWADEIVIEDEEPDYFFIELSLSSNINNTIEILNQYQTEQQNAITARVLLSLAYTKLTDDCDDATVESILVLLNGLAYYDSLTQHESYAFWAFVEYDFYYAGLEDMKVELIKFLSVYKEFTLANMDSWLEIDSHIEVALAAEKKKSDAINAAHTLAWEKSERNRNTKRNIALAGIVIFGMAVIYSILYYDVNGNFSLSELWKSNPSSFFTVGFIIMLWAMRKFWGEEKK